MENNSNHRHNKHFPDQGPSPYVSNIKRDALINPFFRRTLWTGFNLQLTLMSIPIQQDIGWEKHDHVDQFLYVEQGDGMVVMGTEKEKGDFEKIVCGGYGIFVPAGTWHNVVNIGGGNLKIFSIYSPPEHPKGYIQPKREDAEEE